MIPKPVEGSNPAVILTTPLATVGVFVAILRKRFERGAFSDPALPWIWIPDTNGNTDKNHTGIFVESGWNENIEARNVRPGVWVDRDQNVYGRVVIGDQDQMAVYKNVRLQNFYCTGEMDILVECTSSKRGESMTIGSVVQDFLHMSNRLIQAYFGFRNISPVILGRTVPFEKDDKMWNSPVSFRVEYENRWATAPASVALHELALVLANKDDPEKYLREIAVRSIFGEE